MFISDTILEGIIIGGAGGFVAGMAIWVMELIRKEILKACDKSKLKKWLAASPHIWRSTTSIASHNNMTKDRVRYIASICDDIKLNTKDGNESDEKWCLKSRENEA